MGKIENIEKKASKYASKVWEETENAVWKFIALSRMCKIPDDVTKKCLNEIIETGFQADSDTQEGEDD